jgi:hypothetical protein
MAVVGLHVQYCFAFDARFDTAKENRGAFEDVSLVLKYRSPDADSTFGFGGILLLKLLLERRMKLGQGSRSHASNPSVRFRSIRQSSCRKTLPGQDAARFQRNIRGSQTSAALVSLVSF